MSIATSSTAPSCSSLNASKKVRAGLAASLGDEQHTRAVQVVDHGEIAVTLPKALLVDV